MADVRVRQAIFEARARYAGTHELPSRRILGRARSDREELRRAIAEAAAVLVDLVNVDQSGQTTVTRRIYNLYAAKTALSNLVDRAAAGEEIIIAKAGTPRAKLVPIRTPRTLRKPGGWEGRVRIAKNFDAPLPKPLRDVFERGK